jgi:hypothetical protein
MPAICQSIDVAAPVGHVRAAWPHFLQWALVGSRRFSCSELACVNAVDSGAVRFQGNGDHATVTFELGHDGNLGLVQEEQLSHDLWHDLMLFKQYIEEHHLEPVERQRHEDELRRSTPDRAHRCSPTPTPFPGGAAPGSDALSEERDGAAALMAAAPSSAYRRSVDHFKLVTNVSRSDRETAPAATWKTPFVVQMKALTNGVVTSVPWLPPTVAEVRSLVSPRASST